MDVPFVFYKCIMENQKEGTYSIVLFDGLCNLCNWSVDFIINRDKKGRFKFASLQSETGQRLLASHTLTADTLSSVILIEQDLVYFKSDAALRIARNLSGLWPGLYGLMVIPKFLRDPIYSLIARNRYVFFGKKETCRLPTPEERKRFIEV